jgi:hypothetical protein
MDSLLNLYGIAGCLVAAASVAVLLVTAFVPKARREDLLRMVGRWWTGF